MRFKNNKSRLVLVLVMLMLVGILAPVKRGVYAADTIEIKFDLSDSACSVKYNGKVYHNEDTVMVPADQEVTFFAEPNSGYEICFWRVDSSVEEVTSKFTFKPENYAGADKLSIGVYAELVDESRTEYKLEMDDITFESLSKGYGYINGMNLNIKNAASVDKGVILRFSKGNAKLSGDNPDAFKINYEYNCLIIDPGAEVESFIRVTPRDGLPVGSYNAVLELTDITGKATATAKISFTVVSNISITTGIYDGNGTVSEGGVYDEGENVTVKATPADGYYFYAWMNIDTGEELSTYETYTFKAEKPINLGAFFRVIEYVYITADCDKTMGTVSGGGKFLSGKDFTLTATPKQGYKFMHWETISGDVVGYEPSITLFANYDEDYIAVFDDASKSVISIENADVSGIPESTPYSGAELKPLPVVTMNGQTLSSGSDYEVKYSNNKEVGTATVIITGRGNYSGEIRINFSITESSNTAIDNNAIKDNSQKGSGSADRRYSNEWVNGLWYNGDGTQTYEGRLEWKSNETGWWIEDTSGWYPVSQWQKIDGKWYYFTASGYMDYSEYRDGCWLNADGSMDEAYTGGTWKSDATGWWYEDNGWYPVSQYLWIDGTNYYFGADGYWQ